MQQAISIKPPLHHDVIKRLFSREYLAIKIALLSLLITTIRLAYGDPINPDGTLYIATAKAFVQGGVGPAVQTYGWPFYAILIGTLKMVTGLSYIASGALLNAVLDAGTAVIWVKTWEMLTEQSEYLFWAVLLFILFHYLIQIRTEVIRGHGYYFFMLTGFYYFIKFQNLKNFNYLFSWFISTATATLFRIEGVAFIILMPLLFLFTQGETFKHRLFNTIKAYTLPLGGLLGLLIIAWSFGLLNETVFSTSRIKDILHQILFGVTNAYHHVNLLSTKIHPILSIYSSTKQASTILLTGLMGLLIWSIALIVNPIFFGLSIWAMLKNKVSQNKNNLIIWYGIITINIIIAYQFLLQQAFFDRRFGALLAMMILMAVPAEIGKLYQAWRTEPRRIIYLLGLLPLVIWAVGAIGNFGPSRHYYITAGQWIKTHSKATDKILTNKSVILFYSTREGIKITADPEKLLNIIKTLPNSKQYRYLAMTVSHHQPKKQIIYIKLLKQKPIKTFINNRKNKVVIFKLTKN